MQSAHAAVWVAVALVGAGWAGGGDTAPSLRLGLDLVDGSCVIGTPTLEAVPVQTSYAKMDIPLKEILTITMGSDHVTGAVELRNGDKLKGVIGLKPIELETVFGQVAVGIEHLRTLRTLPGGVTPGLVLCFPFDRDAGARVDDQSGLGNHGFMEGARWVARGQGGALRLDGAGSAVRVPHNAALDTPEALSVLAWIKGDQLSAQSHANLAGALVNKFYKNNTDPAAVPTDGSGWFLQVHAWENAGAVSGGLWDKATGWSGDGTALVADGTWHFVGMVYAGGPTPSLHFYVDGVEDATAVAGGTLPASIRSNDKDLYIGRWAFDSVHPPFRGEIDELRVYNRALTAVEVKAIYDAQKQGG